MIPITTMGRLHPCVLLAFDAPAGQVRTLVPAPLVPVERDGRAFWNVVVCRVEKMRLAGVPRWLGVSYVHVAYRIYVKCLLGSGQWVEGLYFVRSDVDRSLISVPGNGMSDFRFHRSTIALRWTNETLNLSVKSGGAFDARLSVETGTADEWPTDALLKYQPLDLSCTPGGKWVRLAEVVRDDRDWAEAPVRVVDADFRFFETMKQDARLLHATRVRPIDYRWTLGRVARTSV